MGRQLWCHITFRQLMNSSLVTFATWHAHSNVWLLSSNKGIWVNVTAITSPSSQSLDRRFGNSFRPHSNLAGTKLVPLMASPSEIWLQANSQTPYPYQGNHPSETQYPTSHDQEKPSARTPRPNKEVKAKSKLALEKFNKKNPRSFAQVAKSAENVLRIREAFPALPIKKILEIHNAAFPIQTKKKIQITTKGPSRKQALVPLNSDQIQIVMKDANIHIGLINAQLKTIKSTVRAECFRPTTGGISIITNSVPASSDFTTINRYIKTIEGAKIDNSSTPRPPQSKSYLKIIGIPFKQSNGSNLNMECIFNYLQNGELFEDISLTSKPRVIKASPKSDMAIVWIDIWDS